MDMQAIRQAWTEAERLRGGGEVEAALRRMAEDITARLETSNPICLCVMTGGIVPTGQLLPLLHFPLQLDYIHASRYRGQTSGGELHWIKKPGFDLKDRCVLLVDDILDEGLTLAALIDYCRGAGAGEVLSAVLADKQRPRAPGGLERADFTGLNIPNRYVFGYGLDYHDYWRNAPGIYAVKGL